MDTIAFVTVPDSRDPEILRVQVLVNGVELADLAREVELPFAQAEGSPTLAGAYLGLDASEALPPSQLFFGSPASQLYVCDERVEVLGCECGEPGCWPLVCRITVDGDRVVWSDFHQPHRDADSPAGHWHHEALGPFTFARSQYEEALRRAAASAPG